MPTGVEAQRTAAAQLWEDESATEDEVAAAGSLAKVLADHHGYQVRLRVTLRPPLVGCGVR